MDWDKTMILNLIEIRNRKTQEAKKYAINDKHYNAMLATGGSNFDLEYSWDYLGDVEISEEILNEEGYKYDRLD